MLLTALAVGVPALSGCAGEVVVERPHHCAEAYWVHGHRGYWGRWHPGHWACERRYYGYAE
jgi:hypothetical protein